VFQKKNFRAHQRNIQIEKEENMFWHKKIRIIRMHVVVLSKRMRCFSHSLNLSPKKKLSTEYFKDLEITT
jgi:hypothetical protein